MVFAKVIEEKRKRCDKLHELLADPKVIANTSEYQAYAKELAGLTPIITAHNEFLKVSNDIKDLDKVLGEKAHAHDKDFLVLAEEEKHKLEKDLKAVEAEIEELLLEKESGADRDIIMEVRAGTGGLEASLFAADLLRMYSKYAARKGWKVELIDSSMTEKGGYKEVIFSISGKNVYGSLKFESGTHRVQRVPETEASGRIHTSAATVAVLPEAEEVEIDIKPEDLRIDVFRSGGAGGQGVNRTDSAVRLTYLPTGMVVTCQDERSQLKNKAKAMRVLRARLYDAKRTEHDKKISQERKSQVGTGDRSEKIRTYNFPDRRITDHRIGFTVHNMEDVLEGDLDEIVGALKQEEKKLRIKAAAA
ncbi:MAG: peptide chain release factor 1 [Candidatus Omnitrophica bacterium]|nr:peptide chain release factor 1 [Candidatus Omnitrophota bacterium]MDD5437037.1 peptide chain release factor 1 [Candidatus Omnitrophota bacterium]